MSTDFVTSDLHLGHEKCCTVFKRPDGSPLRPFANAEEMNDQIIKRWNSVVGKNDKVYVLGDVVINKKHLPLLNCLNGTKRLVRGNHDIFSTEEYLKYFKEVYGVRILANVILSHIPLHPDSVSERYIGNIHGHLHDKVLKDPRYLNVSVEQTNYTPITLEQAISIMRKNQDANPVPKNNYKRTGPG